MTLDPHTTATMTAVTEQQIIKELTAVQKKQMAIVDKMTAVWYAKNLIPYMAKTIEHFTGITYAKIMGAEGIGMSRKDLDRLFTLFQQAEGTHARGAGGLGLGLAIVRYLAGLMGGDVSAESVQGLGSAFTVRLPLPPA